MVHRPEADPSAKSFLYLLLGYLIVAPTVVYTVAATLGSFATERRRPQLRTPF